MIESFGWLSLAAGLAGYDWRIAAVAVGGLVVGACWLTSAQKEGRR